MAKLVVITVAILLAAGSAHAATPRLSCEGVTQDDLIAVCGNEKLSRTDRMTTEMFESARRIDRAATLSVARAFLKIARAQFLIAAYEWHNDISAIEFKEFGRTNRVFDLEHRLKPLMEVLNGRLRARAVSAADRL